jgi:hypothetical protein
MALTLVVLFAAALSMPIAAAAQSTTGGDTGSTTGPVGGTQTTGPGGDTQSTAGSEDTQTGQDETQKSTDAGDDSQPWLSVAVLLFGLVVVVVFFYYLNGAQGQYYRTSEVIVTLGKDVPRAVPVVLTELDRGEVPVEIDGPGVVVVGEEAEFSAKRGDEGPAVAWSIAPVGAGDATVDPASGPTTKVKAAAAGSYKLVAREGATVVGEVSLNAIVPEGGAEENGSGALPFVGAGYGTLVIAVVILTVAGALGFAGILETSALATLFGAIAGYIFVKGAGGNADGTAGSGGGSGSTGGAGGP